MTFLTFAVATTSCAMTQPSVAAVQNYSAMLTQKTRQVNERRVGSRSDDRSSGRLHLVEPVASYQKSPTQVATSQLDDRGSGRLHLVEPVESRKKSPTQVATRQPIRSMPFRLIAIGSRESIMEQIRMLHLLGYAELAQWSNLQRGSKPGEFLSILTVRGIRGV